MNLNKCPYNLSEDYEMIFDYLNKSNKLLFALFLYKHNYCSVATCGVARAEKIIFSFDNSLQMEYVNNNKDDFISFCMEKQIKFIMP